MRLVAFLLVVPNALVSAQLRRTSRGLQGFPATVLGNDLSAPLGPCQGECVDDSDCEQGLTCTSRNPGDLVRGCSLTIDLLFSAKNFCVEDPFDHSEEEETVSDPDISFEATSVDAVYIGNGVNSNLGLCEGDCDVDSNCAPGLVCFQRSAGEGVPGCTLSSELAVSDFDFCYDPNPTAPAPAPVQAETLTPAVFVGNGVNVNLSLCQGDCDSDSDCAGSLICYQRAEGDEVPGCLLSEDLVASSFDFCTDASFTFSPTSSPTRTFKPTLSPVVLIRPTAPVTSPVTAPIQIPIQIPVPTPVQPSPVQRPVVAPVRPPVPTLLPPVEPPSALPPPVMRPTPHPTRPRSVDWLPPVERRTPHPTTPRSVDWRPQKHRPRPNPNRQRSRNSGRNDRRHADLISNIDDSVLGLCEGDCDSDRNCAEGLVCYQRDRGDSVPFCKLNSALMNTNHDFCIPSSRSSAAKWMEDERQRTTDEISSFTDLSTKSLAVQEEHFEVSTIGRPSTPFALKLYWEEGYYWQQESYERKWCMGCGYDCTPGSNVAVYNCEESAEMWTFVEYEDGSAQIRHYNWDLCLETIEPDQVVLAVCDNSLPEQRFVALGGSFDHYRFEISPMLQPGLCFTQDHHPKMEELLYVEPCSKARKDRTSFWNKY